MGTGASRPSVPQTRSFTRRALHLPRERRGARRSDRARRNRPRTGHALQILSSRLRVVGLMELCRNRSAASELPTTPPRRTNTCTRSLRECGAVGARDQIVPWSALIAPGMSTTERLAVPVVDRQRRESECDQPIRSVTANAIRSTSTRPTPDASRIATGGRDERRSGMSLRRVRSSSAVRSRRPWVRRCSAPADRQWMRRRGTLRENSCAAQSATTPRRSCQSPILER